MTDWSIERDKEAYSRIEGLRSQLEGAWQEIEKLSAENQRLREKVAILEAEIRAMHKLPDTWGQTDNG